MINFLLALDTFSVVALFIMTIMFDAPRYLVGFIVVALTGRDKMRPFKLTTSAVVAPGESIVEIMDEHRFILAWFPTARWYNPQVGDRVTVHPGGATASMGGRIVKAGSVAQPLPKEFQKSFAPVDRQQFFWIETDEELALPYLSKVTIGR